MRNYPLFIDDLNFIKYHIHLGDNMIPLVIYII